MAKGKHKLARMVIIPGDNGGHSVQHDYAPKASYSKGMNGGMGMSAPPSEEHSFGPKDHGNLMKHIATVLALKGLTEGAAGPDQAAGGLPGRRQAPQPGESM